MVHPRDDDWPQLTSRFPVLGGTRQVFDLAIELVTSSCGTGVPVMNVQSIRADKELEPFYAEMSADELTAFWSKKNVTSLDGYPTNIFADS